MDELLNTFCPLLDKEVVEELWNSSDGNTEQCEVMLAEMASQLTSPIKKKVKTGKENAHPNPIFVEDSPIKPNHVHDIDLTNSPFKSIKLVDYNGEIGLPLKPEMHDKFQSLPAPVKYAIASFWKYLHNCSKNGDVRGIDIKLHNESFNAFYFHPDAVDQLLAAAKNIRALNKIAIHTAFVSLEGKEYNDETTPDFRAHIRPDFRLKRKFAVHEDEKMDVNDVSNSLVLHDDGQMLKHTELKGIDAVDCVVTQLKEHQKVALEFMTLREKKEFKGCLGGMLLDDAGLGKSLVILSLICSELSGTTLIICPSHVIHVWTFEIQKHIEHEGKNLNVLVYQGSNRKKATNVADYDIILTSFNVIRMETVKSKDKTQPTKFEKTSIFNEKFHRVVLDEAHFIRNKSTKTTQAVLEIRAKCKWVVTATPVQNRIDDMFPYLNFLGIFASYGLWKRDVLDAMKSNPKKAFSSLQSVLKEIGIRRQNTILNLPKHSELRCTLELEEAERVFYDALFKYSQDRISKILREIDAFVNNKRNSRERMTKEDNKKLRKAKMNIMVMLLRLRQASCHPMLAIRGMKKLNGLLQEGNEEEDTSALYERVLGRAVKKLQTPTSNTLDLLDEEEEEELAEDEDEECIVCHDREATHIAKPCGHRCCEECWEEYFETSGKMICPMCRAVVRSISSIEMAVADKNADSFVNREFKTSSKLNKVLELIIEEEDHKFVIVSQWRELLKLVAEALSQNKISFMQLDGSTIPEKRGEMVKKFQNNKDIKVCLLSLHAAAEGITLTEADRVIHLDPWWNPSKTFQASSRVYRIGQKNEVVVRHLHVKNTVEDQIQILQNKKKQVAIASVGEGKVTNDMTWANEIKLLMKLKNDE